MFWSDKTEAPTPKRREDARKQGIVPRSAELTGTIVLISGAIAAGWMLPSWYRSLGEAFSALLVQGDWAPLWHKCFLPALAFIVGLMTISLLVGLLQTRFLFTLYPLRWDWQKVNPITGMRRMFSAMALWDTVRSLLKAIFIGYLGFVTLRAGMDSLIGASNLSVTQSVVAIANLAWQVLWRCLLALLLLAIIDYAVQWWRVERTLRMTRQEVKDELKQTEGDPNVKARLRRRYRQLVMHRQIQRVREATVVVTNPTHLAVAMRYHPKELPAPQVIAKGSDWLAQRIVQEAQRHGIPVVSNAPLAQALMRVPIGALIPPELYQAAAEVLAHVFRITGRTQEVLGQA